MINLLAALTWDPGVRGVLTVAVAIVILMGSVFLLLATDSGPRLGFLIAITALFGWLTLMGTTWTIYGIGKKGIDPTWSVKEINYNNLDVSGLAKAHGLPEPSKLPNPESYLAKDPALAKQFPVVEGVKRPGLGDLLSVDPDLEKDIKQKASLPKCWELLASSDSQTGEANAAASNYVIATRKLFTAQTDFVIQAAYSCGGKDKGSHPHCAISAMSSYGNCVRRLGFKIKRTVTWPLGNPPHYAVVQLQAVVPQVTPAGQPPPLPVADPKANVISVVMERNLGNRRLPAVGVTVFSAIVFGLGCNSLHRRDKLVAKARAAADKG